MDDREIIELFEARSLQAIDETKAEYDALCRSIAGKLLRSEEDVEECVSDTYLALWDAIPPAKPSPLSAYIAKVVRNLALKRLEQLSAEKRSWEATVSLAELDACLAGPDNLEENLNAKALRQCITVFLQTQRKDSRLIFLRRYFFFDSIQEIAGRYGISESKVKSSLMRTRNKLRTYLIQEGFDL